MFTSNPLVYRLDGRLHEWVMSAAMIFFGFGILIQPRTAHGSILQFFLRVFSAEWIAAIFLFIGFFSIGALIANGASMAVGPRVRSICAILRAGLWAEFTTSMIKVSFDQGFVSPMVYFWGTFTAAEIYIAYRAVLDVRAH